MFRLKHLKIDTLQEHVVFIHEDAVQTGSDGLFLREDGRDHMRFGVDLHGSTDGDQDVVRRCEIEGAATHVLIDIPVGATAKIRTGEQAEQLASVFRSVADAIDLRLDVIVTEAHGPIGWGIGPRLEALDALAVLRREAGAPLDLREKSIYLAARLLEMTGVTPPAGGYRAAQHALDSGAAQQAFERIVAAQGVRPLPPGASLREVATANSDGRLREIDCLHMARVAKCAGAPAHGRRRAPSTHGR